MRLTLFSDYALRLLMFAASHNERLVTIEEAANAYNISRAHLMKVANLLTSNDYLESVRGRSGGLRLKRPANEINLGDLIRKTEPDLAIVECLGPLNRCPITPRCKLKTIARSALNAFVAVFDSYTLADLSMRPEDFATLLVSSQGFHDDPGTRRRKRTA